MVVNLPPLNGVTSWMRMTESVGVLHNYKCWMQPNCLILTRQSVLPLKHLSSKAHRSTVRVHLKKLSYQVQKGCHRHSSELLNFIMLTLLMISVPIQKEIHDSHLYELSLHLLSLSLKYAIITIFPFMFIILSSTTASKFQERNMQ